MRELFRVRWAVLGLAIVVLALTGCGDDEETDADNASASSGETSSDGVLSGDPVAVKVGVGPFFDYQLFRVAEELGIADDAKLDLEIGEAAQPPIREVLRGDYDIGYGCHACAFSSLEAFPDYRNFMITNQFKGYVLTGVEGEVKPYSEYFEESEEDFEVAKREFVQNEVVGKRIALVEKNHLGTVAGLLEQGGATTDDVETLDFADGAKAANAFVTGEADFYVGDLPQQARLLYGEEFEGKFIGAAPQQAFGPGPEGALFYSVFFAKEGWLGENRETAKRLVAVWFRATRYLRERPDEVYPIIADAVKSSTGGVLPDDVMQGVMEDLLFYPTAEEAGETFFDENSPLYFMKSVEFHYNQALKEDQAPDGLDLSEYEEEQTLYEEVMNDQALVDFIEAPLK